jgi:tetratricopeptide (TPR) repeat protein
LNCRSFGNTNTFVAALTIAFTNEGLDVEDKATRVAVLVRFYQRYLHDSDTARFIASVASRYSISTLHRILQEGDVYRRRASALALGLIGDYRSNDVLGPLLRDQDRKLRLVVDDALRSIWSRDGSMEQRHELERIVRLNECGDHDGAVQVASLLIESSASFAEAYHQRSLALFNIGEIEHSIEDCTRVLQLNQYHYAAMIGLGHCYLELNELVESLYWFKMALETYPDLEPVRVQVRRLEKAIQEM